MQLGSIGEAGQLQAMQLLAPVLLHDYFEHSISDKTAEGLRSMFPELLFFGLALMVSSGALLMSSDIGSRGSLHIGLVNVDEDGLSKETGDESLSNGVRYTILPPEQDGSMLCVPIRLPAAWRGSQGAGDLVAHLGSLPNERRQYVAQGGALGVLVLVVSTAKELEQYLSQLACFAQLLAPHLLRSGVLRQTERLTDALRQKGGVFVGPSQPASKTGVGTFAEEPNCTAPAVQQRLHAGQNGVIQQQGSNVGMAATAPLYDVVHEPDRVLRLDSRLATAVREILQKLLVHARNGRKKGEGTLAAASAGAEDSVLWMQSDAANGAWHTGLNGQGGAHGAHKTDAAPNWLLSPASLGLAVGNWMGPAGPCTRPLSQELLLLLVEVLRTAETASEQALVAINDLNTTQEAEAAAASEEGTDEDGPRPGTIVLPGPDELQGDVSQLRPEDRWFEHNWLWLNFKDLELDRRYNWWHNRQCVKLDSGLCWFWFTLLVVLLTVEPFSLANFHPNAFALAFLIVPGVYILHRWDTDWYIKRRHAVIIVQTTYYLVYNVIFIAPVFMVVKPPHVLRRPLWLLRVTGVDCMLMQLCFQLPFEKFFWLGILHLGIISSLQRSICDQLYADLPGARCGLLISSIQVVLGFMITMAIAWRWEKARRKAFLKHVRAERPDPAALQRRGGRQAKKVLRELAMRSHQDSPSTLQRSLVQQVRH